MKQPLVQKWRIGPGGIEKNILSILDKAPSFSVICVSSKASKTLTSHLARGCGATGRNPMKSSFSLERVKVRFTVKFTGNNNCPRQKTVKLTRGMSRMTGAAAQNKEKDQITELVPRTSPLPGPRCPSVPIIGQRFHVDLFHNCFELS